MQTRHALLRALVAAVALACGAEAPAQGAAPAAKAWCERAVPALREALRTAPTTSAERAIAANDLLYLEWYGLGGIVPGVKGWECARKAKIVKPFEGTSDALCSKEHGLLVEQGRAYAEAYNQRIAAARKAVGLLTCDDV